MTAPEHVDGRSAYADRRFQTIMEEYRFMLGYGVTPATAARRAGTNIAGLRETAQRRGVRLPERLADL